MSPSRSYDEHVPRLPFLSGVRRVTLIAVGIAFVGSLLVFGAASATIDADEIGVLQDPFDGELHVWTAPGMYFTSFGTVTTYKRSEQFKFEVSEAEGGADTSIKVRFNDGGEAHVSGSLRFDLPLDPEAILKIHTHYHSMAAVTADLIRPAVMKSAYMSGPLMSSTESYASRRAELINFIGDQVEGGVYKTHRETAKQVDPLSGEEKTVDVTVIDVDPATNSPLRQEKSIIQDFKIHTYGLSLSRITYDAGVEEQIKAQQSSIMQVQTAAAEARKAEQAAITAEKNGQAEAAKAKWAQEAIAATAVTKAQQELAVQNLSVQTAEAYKREQILRGEGEAERRRLAMSADGALDQKLQAWVEVNKAYAAELGKQPWVPTIQMGGPSGGNTQAFDLISLLQASTARDLALTFRPGGSR